MIPQSNGKIFLAEERGEVQLNWFRSYRTFNFGEFYNEYKKPVGDLYVLNDDTLAGGKVHDFEVETDSEIILVPVVGAIFCITDTGLEGVVEAGDCMIIQAPAGSSLTIGNVFNDELVNYLQFWFKKKVTSAAYQTAAFNINSGKNTFVELLPGRSSAPVFYMGKWGGREECTHRLKAGHNALFLFVLEGAFEVQYRLLHARDGLLLWDVTEVELEALSSNAIIMAVEMNV